MFANQFTAPVMRLVNLWNEFQQVLLGVDRLGDILNHPVEITSEKVTGKQKAYPDDPKSPEFDIKEQIIPAKYNTNTELKVDVKNGGATEADFTLVSGASAKS